VVKNIVEHNLKIDDPKRTFLPLTATPQVQTKNMQKISKSAEFLQELTE